MIRRSLLLTVEGENMRQSLILIALLIPVGLSSFTAPLVSADLPENTIQVSCFTENGLSLDILGLSSTVFQNSSVLLVGTALFEAIGSQPLVTIKLENSGSNISSVLARVTCDAAFSVVDGSRNYYIGPYYEGFNINATTGNATLEYQADFTQNIERAMATIPLNGTIEKSGIRGRMTFEALIGGAIGIVAQKRFFNVLIQGDANLYVIHCDFTLPEHSDIVEAKNDGEDMQKRGTPYRVDTSLSVAPLQSFGRHLYLEWNAPLVAPLLTQYPYNLILAAFVSLLVGWLSRYSYDSIKARRQKQRVAPVRDTLLRRIEKDIGLLAVWVKVISVRSPAIREPWVHRGLTRLITDSKNGLVTTMGLGNDIVSPDMKQALLELNNRLERLLNSALISKKGPDSLKRNADKTLSQILVLFDILGSDLESTVVKSWLEGFVRRESS
jgi:hypothetical protein